MSHMKTALYTRKKAHCTLERAQYTLTRALYTRKRALYTRKSANLRRASHVACITCSHVTHESCHIWKEPYAHAKELYIHAKEPYTHAKAQICAELHTSRASHVHMSHTSHVTYEKHTSHVTYDECVTSHRSLVAYVRHQPCHMLESAFALTWICVCTCMNLRLHLSQHDCITYSNITHESCHMSRMRHITHQSSHVSRHAGVMSHMSEISHVTYMNQRSRLPHVACVAYPNSLHGSCHTYECVTSHMHHGT